MPTPILLGLPYDAGSSFLRGAAEAPTRIREALWSPASNSWAERGLTLESRLADAGDLTFSMHDDPLRQISDAVADLLQAGSAPVILGGDHAITYPVVRALRSFYPRLSILHIDAHSDLYDTFEGDPYSHACPFARIMEAGLADQLVQVGIRTLTDHQRAQAERFGVEVFDMRRWVSGERFLLHHPVYLSLDLDGLDPAFAPGVSHPEPGGLSVREVLALLHDLDRPLVGADVVELNPHRDPTGVTAVVAAKFVKEIAAQILLSPPTLQGFSSKP